MKKAFTHVLAILMMKIGRRLLRMPTAKTAGPLKSSMSVIRFFNKKSDLLMPLGDVFDIFQDDPDSEEAIRRILTESRDEELLSFLSGLLKHQVLPGRNRIPDIKLAVRVPRRQKNLKLGWVGGHPEGNLMEREYLSQGFQIVDMSGAKVSRERLPAGLDAVEIFGPFDEHRGLIEDALKAGAAVSVHASCIRSSADAQALVEKSRETGTPYRILQPCLFYPPVTLVKKLLQRNEAGLLQTIRIRATVGGTGGALQALMPSGVRYLEHEAFDHFLLLTYFGGSIEKTAAYLRDMNPKSGGQGLVDVKFRNGTSYGLLECTYAPGMFIRSDHFPYDLDAEIAGLHGIIWLRRGMSRPTQDAPVFVRVGRQEYSFGIQSGFTGAWDEAYRESAINLYEMAQGKAPFILSDAEVISAYRSREAAYVAAGSRRVVNATSEGNGGKNAQAAI